MIDPGMFKPDPVGAAALDALQLCLLGNMRGSVVCDPQWRTPTVAGIVRKINESGDFELMPILADALEESGCERSEILLHCRENGQHTFGCWVISLLTAIDGVR